MTTQCLNVLPPQRDFDRAAELVGAHMGVPVDRIKAPRGWVERRARGLALYLTVVGVGHGQRAVARVVGVHHEAVRKALRAVEERRDLKAFDAELSQLEEQMA